MKDTPQITSAMYVSSSGSNLGSLLANAERDWTQWSGVQSQHGNPAEAPRQRLKEQYKQSTKTTQTMPNETTTRRYVQVFIADPNSNIPLEESVLFKGDQKLTDLTDTELFFEVPIAETLKTHNDKRIKWLDKEASKRAGKDVFLDPVRIRELKMVVVTIAQF